MQPRPLREYLYLIAAVIVTFYLAHQFFPKTQTVEHTTTTYVHDTTTVNIPEIHYRNIPGRTDTVFLEGKAPQVVMSADTLFPDSAHLAIKAYLPPMSFFDIDYRPAPQKIITLEKIVTHEIVKTQTTIDLPWVFGGVAAGVIGGIWIAHQVK
jgi:hypothetical protein